MIGALRNLRHYHSSSRGLIHHIKTDMRRYGNFERNTDRLCNKMTQTVYDRDILATCGSLYNGFRHESRTARQTSIVLLGIDYYLFGGCSAGPIGDMMCPDVRIRNNRHCCWTYTVSSSFDPWSGPRTAEKLADARRPLLPEQRTDRQHPTLFTAVWRHLAACQRRSDVDSRVVCTPVQISLVIH